MTAFSKLDFVAQWNAKGHMEEDERAALILCGGFPCQDVSSAGGGSVGEACTRTDRDYVGVELSREYFEISRDRLAKAFSERGA